MARLTTSWRSALVYTHRWLGIGGCLLFVAWFASGVVMMYARMPSLSAEERLYRLPPLDLSRATLGLGDAARIAGLAPDDARLTMHGGRPLFRLRAGRQWAAVFADDGTRLPLLGEAEALATARAFAPERQQTVRHDARLTEADQWTLSSALRPLFPLHRLALGDPAGTELYVSAVTGEPVMKTTREGRVWGYLGAVVHWLYFTPLRRRAGLWTELIIWLSIAGTVMCLSGLVWGVWRLSPASRYRLRRVASHSPYAGLMKWHHYAGLVFGLTTCTWIFSGLMSMTPWDWSPGHSPTQAQRLAFAGGPMHAELVTLARIRDAERVVAREWAPREVGFHQFDGRPFLEAFRPPGASVAIEWSNTDFPAFVAPSTLPHRLVSLLDPGVGAFDAFPRDTVAAAVVRAMPGAALAESVWIDSYDAYYYDRAGALALPVLRAKFRDADETWLYADPRHGELVQREQRRSRLERWLYHGLHSLDFPGFYERRPLWDLVLIALSLGGLVSSVTTLAPAWRRLRSRLRGLVSARG